MNNIILIIAEVIVCYIVMTFLVKKYKEDGLYIYAIIATLASCIMTLKRISIMGINIPVGFGATTSLIIGGNLITQQKGKEELRRYLAIIFLSAIIGFSYLNLSGLVKSSEYNFLANESYSNIFKYNLRVYIALIISLIISIWSSSKIYYLLKRIYNKLIISNIFSIVIIELFENILFVLIAFLFENSFEDIILCTIFRYIIKSIIGIIGTIPLYAINKINK